MTFGERLKEFIDHKRMNIRSFEIASGLNNGTVYRVIKNNSSLNGDSIAAIGKQWEELDLNWLILGEGEMLKMSPKDKELNNTENSKNANEGKWDFEAQLNRADNHIKIQNDMINLLKDIIEEQKKAANQA